MEKRSNGISGHETLVIVLSTVFGVIGILAIGLGGFWYLRNRRRHRLFNRGLTPIGDEEIETWKVNREEEKEAEAYASSSRSSPPRTHTAKDSTSSARIQYQKGGPAYGRPSTSTETATAPRSFISMDLPRAPEAAVFARAPNARTGLTDETVPGDDPFVKRQPSRLQKMHPSRASSNHSRSSRTRTGRSQTNPEKWHRSADSSPVGQRTGSGHSRIYSSSFAPPQLRRTATVSSSEDKETLAGLSPPPSRHRELIGQALG